MIFPSSDQGHVGVLGYHTLFELYDCDRLILNQLDQVREILLEAARLGNATIINNTFHQFSPQGISGVVVIAESHLAVHTWPEHGYAAIDLFSCSDKIDTARIEGHLRLAFHSRRLEKIVLHRGKNL